MPALNPKKELIPVYDASFKIVLLGDPELDLDISGIFTGYLTAFSQEGDKKIIGTKFYKTKNFTIDKKIYMLQFWDLNVNEKFRFTLPNYCYGANGAVLFYNVSRSQTLDNIGKWTNIVRQRNGDIPIMLVGIIPNEKHERQVSIKEGRKFAKSKNLNIFIEYSVSTGVKVEKIFEALTRLILAK